MAGSLLLIRTHKNFSAEWTGIQVVRMTILEDLGKSMEWAERNRKTQENKLDKTLYLECESLETFPERVSGNFGEKSKKLGKKQKSIPIGASSPLRRMPAGLWRKCTKNREKFFLKGRTIMSKNHLDIFSGQA